MPPKENDKLSTEQTDHIRNWIEGGASWPGPDRVVELLKEKDPETVLNEIFAERDLLYEQAECIIETGQQSPQQIASEIIRKLCNEDSDHNF